MDFPLFNKESILCLSLYLLYDLSQKYTRYSQTTSLWNTLLLCMILCMVLCLQKENENQWSGHHWSLLEIFDSLQSSDGGLCEAPSVPQALQRPCKLYEQEHTGGKSNHEALTAPGEPRLLRKPLLEWSIGVLHVYQLTVTATYS